MTSSQVEDSRNIRGIPTAPAGCDMLAYTERGAKPNFRCVDQVMATLDDTSEQVAANTDDCPSSCSSLESEEQNAQATASAAGNVGRLLDWVFDEQQPDLAGATDVALDDLLSVTDTVCRVQAKLSERLRCLTLLMVRRATQAPAFVTSPALATVREAKPRNTKPRKHARLPSDALTAAIDELQHGYVKDGSYRACIKRAYLLTAARQAPDFVSSDIPATWNSATPDVQPIVEFYRREYASLLLSYRWAAAHETIRISGENAKGRFSAAIGAVHFAISRVAHNSLVQPFLSQMFTEGPISPPARELCRIEISKIAAEARLRVKFADHLVLATILLAAWNQAQTPDMSQQVVDEIRDSLIPPVPLPLANTFQL